MSPHVLTTQPSLLRRPALLASLVLLTLCLSSWMCQAHAALRASSGKGKIAQSASQLFDSDMKELQDLARRQRQLRSTAAQPVQNVDAGATASQVQKDADAQEDGVSILFRGAEYASFERPLPDVVEKSLFKEFEEYFNQTQPFHAEGANVHEPMGRQVVVSIAGGRVSGVLGEVHNSQGKLLQEFSVVSDASIPANTDKVVHVAPCRRFKRLATAIQKYGHMYHHFVLEVLPRVILLRPYLDADTKVLLFGSAHEAKWLAALGIPASQVEVYDPSVEYCADELLVPSMSPIITPPKENYELLQAAFQAGVSSLDDESTDLIVYCSRRDAHDRVVANEAQLLALIRERYPTSELFVYTGRESVEETIRIFRRASVVVGMHGAGLSHIVFAPRGAAVVEFLFMPDPPMMFWHTASALQQHYIMVPLAQSWWLERSVTVPAQDVLDALALALGSPKGDCPLGQVKLASSDLCMACPPGTYRPTGSSTCIACAPGRHSAEGAAFCSTCQAGSYSDEPGFSCVACPGEGATLFPGASSPEMCTSVEALQERMKEMFSQEVLMGKLVSMRALEMDKPKTAGAWVAAAVSVHRWQEMYRHRQLKHRFLNELFNADVQTRELEVDTVRRLGQAAHRRLLQTGYKHRRHMLSYH